MKSPKDMRIIQIDITNACVFQCSNCTRFCGHHKKPFFMDYETFVKAVDSLDGYVGTIGMMGGEPTLNRDFERMARYLASKKPQKITNVMLRPQRHFMDAIHDLEFEHTFRYPCGQGMRQTVDGPGLWATTKGNYKKYYETIQDTIQYQALNDHSRAMYHQAGLISRKALGIPDEEWIPMRDQCWIQNEWSASITPKGAFFCEVAAALDMLFDGPGGWEIEKGWYEREPSEFGEQLQWCELCGLACHTFMRNANEQVYDVSEDIYEKLKECGSRLVGTDHINVIKIQDGVIDQDSTAEGKRFSKSMPYTESYSARYDEEHTSLTYKVIEGLIICDDSDAVDCAVEFVSHFSSAYVLAPQAVLGEIKSQTGRCEHAIRYEALENKPVGEMISELLSQADAEHYLMIVRGKIRIKEVLDDINELVLNPGTLLYSELQRGEENPYFRCDGNGEAMLLSGAAQSYKDIDRGKLHHISGIRSIKDSWQVEKIFPFHPDTVCTAPTVAIHPGKNYVIYGAGRALGIAVDRITKAGATVAAVVDSNEKKWGREMAGFIVKSPNEVLQDMDSYDCAMIGAPLYYHEIKHALLGYGIEEGQMAWL